VSQDFSNVDGYAVLITQHAVQFLQQHQGQHLDNDQLVKRCCAHLISTAAVSNAVAERVTMHALAEIQCMHLPAYFDTGRSTPLVVCVVDPGTGNVYQLTASDILQLARAQNDAPRDPSHGIQLCGRVAQLS
jgi:hypothetical protein